MAATESEKKINPRDEVNIATNTDPIKSCITILGVIHRSHCMIRWSMNVSAQGNLISVLLRRNCRLRDHRTLLITLHHQMRIIVQNCVGDSVSRSQFLIFQISQCWYDVFDTLEAAHHGIFQLQPYGIQGGESRC